MRGFDISNIIRRLCVIVATAMICGYQLVISPLIGPACRFTPSCSQYAFEAINRYGPFKGSVMALKRLLKCHPWHEGGYDPVP